MLNRIVAQRDSLAFLIATTLAYGLDYLFNVVSGRWLGNEQFGTLVALAGVGQILVVGSRVIQTVTTRYISRFRADTHEEKVRPFITAALRVGIWGGLGITVLLCLLAFPLARFLRIEDMWAVFALLGGVGLMVVRPIIGGTLQGQQRFLPLGIIQIIQASIRLLAGALLILAGWGAFGAMIALPIASLIALVYGAWLLRDLLGGTSTVSNTTPLRELAHYSGYTAAGLIGFALLINMDAILVKRFFDADTAGVYGAAVTLGKVVQFFPVAIIMVLFPKAAHRQATKRNPAAVLPPAFALITAVCLGVSILYFAFPDLLVGTIFGDKFEISGRTLGTLGLAMWLLSLTNVWLNYFLSLNRVRIVYLIWTGVITQYIAFNIWHDQLWHLPTVMAINALWLTVAGAILFVRSSREVTSLQETHAP